MKQLKTRKIEIESNRGDEVYIAVKNVGSSTSEWFELEELEEILGSVQAAIDEIKRWKK